jgi:Concanavalin A-like lectin/glucanases superfamily
MPNAQHFATDLVKDELARRVLLRASRRCFMTRLASSMLIAAATMAVVGGARTTSGQFNVPYSVDASTLHLWHLNEAAAPASDAVPGGQNLLGLLGGATLSNTSLAPFGNALQTGANGRILLAASALSSSGAATGADSVSITLQSASTRAFTYEAIVRLDFDPAASRTAAMEIIVGEGDVSERAFQFRLDPVGFAGPAGSDSSKVRLEFNNLGGGNVVYANLPLGADPNAPLQGSWYHVAVSYDGNLNTAGNMKFYWTKAVQGTATANLIGSLQQSAHLTMNNNGVASPVGVTNTDFSIGNEGRATGGETEPFIGLIDEVRISSVARSASDFIFPLPLFCDTNGNGCDVDDFYAIKDHFFNQGMTRSQGDLSGDGVVDLLDFRLWKDNVPAELGDSVSLFDTPEPASLWLGFLAFSHFMRPRSAVV